MVDAASQYVRRHEESRGGRVVARRKKDAKDLLIHCCRVDQSRLLLLNVRELPKSVLRCLQILLALRLELVLPKLLSSLAWPRCQPDTELTKKLQVLQAHTVCVGVRI